MNYCAQSDCSLAVTIKQCSTWVWCGRQEVLLYTNS